MTEGVYQAGITMAQHLANRSETLSFSGHFFESANTGKIGPVDSVLKYFKKAA